MAVHRFVCDPCEVVVEDMNMDVHQCPKCGEDMRLDLMVTAARGDYNHISSSLAVSPDQVDAHRKMFPDIDVLPDGRLHFTSTRSQERYCDKTGFYKERQRTKPRGTRIA